jgi:putative FmdB family regulatory protein
MPLYCFKCSECGQRQEDIKPMSESNSPVVCPHCGCFMDRDMAAEAGAVPVGCDTAKPFWSESLAISPDQAAEHRATFPDVLVDRQGRVGFTSHKQREKYLDTCGFFKKSAKLKR